MDQETLVLRHKTAAEALASLHESLMLIKKYSNVQQHDAEETAEYRVHRDLVIKRFEFTLDTTWKYLKFFLEARTGVIQNSPKMVIREC